MSQNMKWRGLLATAIAGMTVFGVGCAQDVGDIDRTQPNKLRKADFDQANEWYYRQQVVDTDVTGSLVFQGLYGDMKRVRWVITENMLIACNTVPVLQGERLEAEFIDGKECYGIAAAFPIRGHFDVQRAYNSATGEQSNVVVENYSDRPWYEREYMRVDWGRNLQDSSISFGSFRYNLQPTDYSGGTIGWTPDQDPGYADPFRTRLDFEDGYMETTTKYYTNPDYDACYALNGQFFSNCTGGEVSITHSFSKVPDTKTFQPFRHVDSEYVLDDNGDRIMTTRLLDAGSATFPTVRCDEGIQAELIEQEGSFGIDRCQPLVFNYFTRFGYFRTENMRFNEQNVLVDSGREFWANHYNIWQTAYDEDGELLPLDARNPKPIVYYLNAEYPADMRAAAQEVARQWDNTFKEAVRVAKGYDTIDQVTAELEELYDGDGRMFKIESNSCMPDKLAPWLEADEGDGADTADLNEIVDRYVAGSTTAGASTLEAQLWGLPVEGIRSLCTEIEVATEGRERDKRFEWEREGDLRKSFFSWVEEENAGWLGYGPSSADPLTGEIVSGSAHIAGWSIRTSAYYAADMVRFLNGTLTEEQIAFGDHIRDYERQVREQAEQTLSQKLEPAGKAAMFERTKRGIPADLRANADFNKRPSINDLPRQFATSKVSQIENESIAMSRAAVASQAADTRFEDFMMEPQVKSLMLADPKMHMTLESIAQANVGSRTLTEEDLDRAYLTVYAPEVNHWRDLERSQTFAEHNVLSAADFTRAVDSLVTYSGVADRFKDATRDEIAAYFAYKMMIGTQLHEVGHTVGLRHNFNASLDALNYHDEYWKIQEAVARGDISADETSSIPLDVAKEVVLGDLEHHEGEKLEYLNDTEFRLASVMDYTGDLTGRFAGLGKYDQAAINFVYGHSVQVWSDDVLENLPPGIDTEFWLSAAEELPELLSGTRAKPDATEEEKRQRRLAGIKNIMEGRKWVSIKEARDSLRQGIIANTQNFNSKSLSAENMPYQDFAVPYNFCSDDRRNFQLGCDVFDWGSSYREIVNHNFNTYRSLQWLYRTRRNRLVQYNENINSYYGFVARTLFSAQRPFRFFSIYSNWNLGSFTDDLRDAAIDSANFYNEIMAMPEPGVYCKVEGDTDSLRLDTNWFFDVQNTYLPANYDYGQGDCDEPVTIQPGYAQTYGYELTDEYGFRIERVGTFIDKLIASQLLFSVSANYLFNAFLTDTRATNISYWTVFKEEMLTTLRGIILNDNSKFGGLVTSKQDGVGTYEPPLMIDRDAFTYGVPNPQDGQPRVFTLLSFNHEFNMLAYALIANSTWQDRHTDFAQYVRVGVGDREVLDFGDAELAEFVNPETNQRYVAPQTLDGGSISVELIDWANDLKNRWLDAVRDAEQARAQFDTLREAYDVNFAPTDCEGADPDDADLKAVCDAMLDYRTESGRAEIRSEQIQDVVGKLELLRWLWGILGPDARR